MHPETLAARRSLALHRLIAQRVLAEPAVVVQAEARVAAWHRAKILDDFHAERWRVWLRLPAHVLAERLVEESAEAEDMRHVTPFTFIVDPRTRWRIWREIAP